MNECRQQDTDFDNDYDDDDDGDDDIGCVAYTGVVPYL